MRERAFTCRLQCSAICPSHLITGQLGVGHTQRQAHLGSYRQDQLVDEGIGHQKQVATAEEDPSAYLRAA